MSANSISVNDGEEFIYFEIDKLPLLYKIKLMGDRWKASRCPYCGASLVRLEKPIEHLHCLGKCERNYVK